MIIKTNIIPIAPSIAEATELGSTSFDYSSSTNTAIISRMQQQRKKINKSPDAALLQAIDNSKIGNKTINL